MKMPGVPQADHPIWRILQPLIGLNTRLYRLTGGRLGGRLDRAPVLLLHHVGRRSGKARVLPLIYLEDAGRFVVVASKGGVDKHPAWYHNLMALPETVIEVGRERKRVRARHAEDSERAAFWPRLETAYRPLQGYQARTARVIPMLVLEPVVS